MFWQNDDTVNRPTRSTLTTMALTADTTRYTSALKHASNHRAEIDQSAHCGCFSCFRRFVAADIRAWIDKDQTALCPRCGIDSVIGSASGFTVDDRFLRNLHLFSVGGARVK